MSHEFKTAKEAEDMLRSLRRASAYCTGENSSRQHGERIREVERECDRLKTLEQRRRHT